MQATLAMTHLPNVISLVSDRRKSEHLATQLGPIRFYDHVLRCTYFVARLDASAFVVVICADQAAGQDGPINEALTALQLAVRGTAVFKALRQG